MLDDLARITKLLRQSDIEYELIFTEHKHHATELAVRAINEGYRKIIAIGGDGTMHEVLNGVFIQTCVPTNEITLAAICTGTGNDWIRMYGFPSTYPDAVSAIAQGNTFLQDVGVVCFEEASYPQKRYMVNAGGVGLDATVVKRFNRLKEQGRRGRFIYQWGLLTSALHYRATGMKIYVDDTLVVNNLVLSATIGVGQYNGGGIRQVPDAIADDGLLDITTIKRIKPLQELLKWRALLNGKIYSVKQVSMHRGGRMRITSSPEVHIEVDGEIYAHTPVEFSVISRAVNVVVTQRFLDADKLRRKIVETVVDK